MTKPKLPLLLTTLLLTGLALTFTTFAAVTVSRPINSQGAVSATANLSLYSDSACTTSLSTLDWGSPTPGTTVTRTIYIKNTGTGISLSLGMTTASWNPTTANGPITITWNKEATTLTPGQSTAATITLTVSPTIIDITNFSVQIYITGAA